MAFPYIKQATERLFATVANGSTDTTLAVENRHAAYRRANFASKEVDLQKFTNGAFISVAGTTSADTGTLELWGYPLNGSAEFLGIHTFTLGTQVAEGGGFYVDTFAESVASVHAITILGAAYDNGKGTLKFDTLGFRHIVALLTAVSAGIQRVYLRPW